jgi:LysR family cys regulon transcriptional activator
MAFDATRDIGLKRLDASHLFETNTTRIAVRRGHYLRGYAYRFLEDCSAALTPEVVKAALDAD